MKHTYNFQSSFGWTNCDICDNDVMCNEYTREDGLVVWLCKKCEDINHL